MKKWNAESEPVTFFYNTGDVANTLGLRTREWVKRLVDQGHLVCTHRTYSGDLLFTEAQVDHVRRLREQYPPVNGRKWEPGIGKK